jgi:hypothetical protein
MLEAWNIEGREAWRGSVGAMLRRGLVDGSREVVAAAVDAVKRLPKAGEFGDVFGSVIALLEYEDVGLRESAWSVVVDYESAIGVIR